MTAETAIQTLIRREIRANGPISFARFMELALYCPNIGYYERPETRIGRGGDYYTSVSVGPLFGELLAFQFSQWLERLPGPVQLVEAGAHDGRLAADILTWTRSDRPELWDRLEYWIIEPSANRQKWQQHTLNEFAAKVRWFAEFPAAVTGIIFSNELLDSLPCQRFGWDAKTQSWLEWRVTEHFTWVGRAVEGRTPVPLAAVLPDRYTVEVNSAANQWWQTAARSLKRGKLLAIDYFLTADQFLRPERLHGTARAYRAHHVSSDLLASPGEQDITAHVNLTPLQHIGQAQGLTTEPLLTQAAFLMRMVGLSPLWSAVAEPSGDTPLDATCDGITSALEAPRTLNPKRRRRFALPPHSITDSRLSQFKTLTHPEHLGERFKVFIQNRAYGTPVL